MQARFWSDVSRSSPLTALRIRHDGYDSKNKGGRPRSDASASHDATKDGDHRLRRPENEDHSAVRSLFRRGHRRLPDGSAWWTSCPNARGSKRGGFVDGVFAKSRRSPRVRVSLEGFSDRVALVIA